MHLKPVADHSVSTKHSTFDRALGSLASGVAGELVDGCDETDDDEADKVPEIVQELGAVDADACVTDVVSIIRAKAEFKNRNHSTLSILYTLYFTGKYFWTKQTNMSI
jgi:hypothetical protein